MRETTFFWMGIHASVDSWTLRMRVLLAFTFFASSLFICNALTIPNLFNWFLDFDDHNEIHDSSQKWEPYGSFDGTQRQSRGGYQSQNTQELSGYQSGAHHYAEDAPSDGLM